VSCSSTHASLKLSFPLKYLWTAKDTWLGPEQNLGATGSIYNLTMDQFEKYDKLFNGAVSARMPTQSPGKFAGQDNGWALPFGRSECRHVRLHWVGVNDRGPSPIYSPGHERHRTGLVRAGRSAPKSVAVAYG
jgi:hypothetical protein